MQLSPRPKQASRFSIGRVATAVAFALVIGSFGIRAARADDNRGGGDRGAAQHHDNGNRGARPMVNRSPQIDNYYVPAPNYYSAPEPDGYYAPGPYYAAPPPEGINLFFGL